MKTSHVVVTAGVGLTCAGLVSYVVSGVRDSQAAIYSSVCQSHFSGVNGALRDYHTKYGKFPPAYVADRAGKPMHSWRILVLETSTWPEWAEVYRAYRFDEPWDGPNNRKLADRMPDFFACPSANWGTKDHKGLANYVVITDPNAVFRGADSASLPDGDAIHADTIILAETLPGIPWLEPRDLELSRMSLLINDPNRPGIASKDSIHPGVVLMDGRIVRLYKPISPEALKEMILIKPPAKEPDAPK